MEEPRHRDPCSLAVPWPRYKVITITHRGHDKDFFLRFRSIHFSGQLGWSDVGGGCSLIQRTCFLMGVGAASGSVMVRIALGCHQDLKSLRSSASW